MEYIYKTKETCSSQIRLNIENDIVTDVVFTGGCSGNLKAIPALINGMTVEEIARKLSGIRCGQKSTSCADQLVKACREAYEYQKRNQR